MSWHAFSTRGHVAHNVLLLNQRPVKLVEHVKIMKENAENEGRGTRVFIYLLRPAAHAFLPLCSIQAHAASAGRAGFASHKPGGLCFSQAPAFSAIRPANPACPGVAVPPKSKPREAGSIRRGGAPQHSRRIGKLQKRLPVLSRAQGAPTSRRRYNTLDLASKIVRQGRPCPLWIPPPRNRPVSLDASPQRKNRMRTVMLIPRFLCQRGRRPL